MGEYQTKESPDRIMWEHCKTISPEKHDSSREERMTSLLEVEWATAESEKGMTQDKMKFVYQGGRLPERKGWALYRRVSDLMLSPEEW